MSDKFAYILFSLNLINGGLVLLVMPVYFGADDYSKILVLLFGLQFSSLFEAGAILFFVNLVAGKAVSQNDAYSKLISVSRFQILLALVSAIAYSYMNLGQDALVAACFLCFHLIFSLYGVPRLFLVCIKDGYERVQMYKALQAGFAFILIVIQLVLANNIYILAIGYTCASFVTLLLILLRCPSERPEIKTNFTEGILYTAKILSSSIGWLFVNFIFGSFLSVSKQPSVGQSWLIFRMADSLIGARFANRISTYVQAFRNINYAKATISTMRLEVYAILIVLTPTMVLSWFLVDSSYTFLLAAWLILNRLNSAANIFILSDFSWKNVANLVILLASGCLAVLYMPDKNPVTIIIVMWLCLVISNFAFKKRQGRLHG